jgi:hypothetical protein
MEDGEQSAAKSKSGHVVEKKMILRTSQQKAPATVRKVVDSITRSCWHTARRQWMSLVLQQMPM